VNVTVRQTLPSMRWEVAVYDRPRGRRFVVDFPTRDAAETFAGDPEAIDAMWRARYANALVHGATKNARAITDRHQGG
jgi:hypothetical protein